MAREFLCAPYKGPETWESPDTEWSNDIDVWSPNTAAKIYAASGWHGSGCEGDPTKEPTIVAVLEPATGRRWIVTVHAKYEVAWTGYEKEVPTEGTDRSAEEHEPPTEVQ